MAKVKTKELLSKVYGSISEGKFSDANDVLEQVVKGKLRNKLEAVKTEKFPKELKK